MNYGGIISKAESLQILKNELRKAALERRAAELAKSTVEVRQEIMAQIDRDIEEELQQRRRQGVPDASLKSLLEPMKRLLKMSAEVPTVGETPKVPEIRHACPKCGGDMLFPIELAGQQAPCPLCDETITLPPALPRPLGTTPASFSRSFKVIALPILAIFVVGCAVLLALIFGFLRETEPSDKAQSATHESTKQKTLHPDQNVSAQSFEAIRRRAEKGDATAQFALGEMYEKGQGALKNITNAVEWYRRAAMQEHAPAQARLGSILAVELQGEGLAKHAGEGLEWVRKAADQGNVYGQHQLGSFYYLGSGVTQDFAEAAKWYLKAANQEYYYAQHLIAEMYLLGVGVAKDEAEAANWLQRAAATCKRQAENGDIELQFMLAQIYAGGQGVQKDSAEAARWFQRAGEKGNAEIQYRVGRKFAAGDGVKKNEVEADTWFRRAAQQGSGEAALELGDMYSVGKGVPQNSVEACRWFREASKKLDLRSLGACFRAYNAGMRFLEGQGVPKDEGEAARWFRLAALCRTNVFSVTDQITLGNMYATGRGVAQDFTEAVKWFDKVLESEAFESMVKQNLEDLMSEGITAPEIAAEWLKLQWKAAEHGDAEAQYALGQAYEEGKGISTDTRTAFGWFFKAALQGHADAQYKVASAYHTGRGVTRSLPDALKWYKLADANGQPEAAAMAQALAAFLADKAGASVTRNTTTVGGRASSKDGIEVIEFSAKITDQSGSYAHWSWKVTLKNTTASNKQVFAKIQFLDKEGFEVEHSLRHMDLDGGVKQTFTDSVPMKADASSKIAKAVIRLE